MNIFDEELRERLPYVLESVILIIEELGKARRRYAQFQTRYAFWNAIEYKEIHFK